jgi:hypothetical protein
MAESRSRPARRSSSWSPTKFTSGHTKAEIYLCNTQASRMGLFSNGIPVPFSSCGSTYSYPFPNAPAQSPSAFRFIKYNWVPSTNEPGSYDQAHLIVLSNFIWNAHLLVNINSGVFALHRSPTGTAGITSEHHHIGSKRSETTFIRL